MSSNLTISGPHYQIYHSSFSLTANHFVAAFPGSTFLYEWTRNGVTVAKRYGEKGTDVLTLTDAEAPAAGSYRVKVTIAYANTTSSSQSDPFILEMGPDYRDTEIKIDNLPPKVEVKPGDTLTLSPKISSFPAAQETEYRWEKDDLPIIGDGSELSVPITGPSEKGRYSLFVIARPDPAAGSYRAAETAYHVDVEVDLEPYNDNVDYHIHDLRPTRNRGFLYMGYWVIDEIMKAKSEGFEWQKDPTNERFIYKKGVSTLAKGFIEWEDLEVMESRNGYILGRIDLMGH
ncbi:capsid vertex protein [Pantoea phage Phynn]|nr:capsid vertex protein [Pantoea phage Phynn]